MQGETYFVRKDIKSSPFTKEGSPDPEQVEKHSLQASLRFIKITPRCQPVDAPLYPWLRIY